MAHNPREGLNEQKENQQPLLQQQQPQMQIVAPAGVYGALGHGGRLVGAEAERAYEDLIRYTSVGNDANLLRLMQQCGTDPFVREVERISNICLQIKYARPGGAVPADGGAAAAPAGGWRAGSGIFNPRQQFIIHLRSRIHQCVLKIGRIQARYLKEQGANLGVGLSAKYVDGCCLTVADCFGFLGNCFNFFCGPDSRCGGANGNRCGNGCADRFSGWEDKIERWVGSKPSGHIQKHFESQARPVVLQTFRYPHKFAVEVQGCLRHISQDFQALNSHYYSAIGLTLVGAGLFYWAGPVFTALAANFVAQKNSLGESTNQNYLDNWINKGPASEYRKDIAATTVAATHYGGALLNMVSRMISYPFFAGGALHGAEWVRARFHLGTSTKYAMLAYYLTFLYMLMVEEEELKKPNFPVAPPEPVEEPKQPVQQQQPAVVPHPPRGGVQLPPVQRRQFHPIAGMPRPEMDFRRFLASDMADADGFDAHYVGFPYGEVKERARVRGADGLVRDVDEFATLLQKLWEQPSINRINFGNTDWGDEEDENHPTHTSIKGFLEGFIRKANATRNGDPNDANLQLRPLSRQITFEFHPSFPPADLERILANRAVLKYDATKAGGQSTLAYQPILEFHGYGLGLSGQAKQLTRIANTKIDGAPAVNCNWMINDNIEPAIPAGYEDPRYLPGIRDRFHRAVRGDAPPGDLPNGEQPFGAGRRPVPEHKIDVEADHDAQIIG